MWHPLRVQATTTTASVSRPAVGVALHGVAVSRNTVVATLIATIAGAGLQVVGVRQSHLVLPAGFLAGAFPALSLLIRDGVSAMMPSFVGACVSLVMWLPFVLAGIARWGSVAMTVSYPLAALASAVASERLRIRREGPTLRATG
jgi:hypothetical protein